MKNTEILSALKDKEKQISVAIGLAIKANNNEENGQLFQHSRDVKLAICEYEKLVEIDRALDLIM